MIIIRKILVPTDFSGAAARALEYARLLADKLGASLHVMHVMQEPFISSAGMEGFAAPPDLWEAIEGNSRKALEQVLTASDRKRFNATLTVLRGYPAEVIVGYAEKSEIDMIIMGTHGRSPLARALIGSVADRVVRKANCPVMTVHSSE